MQFNNEDNNISSSSPPKKKKKSSTGNKWRVPNFEFDLQSKNTRTLKSKSKPSRRKFDFSNNPTENINLQPHNKVLSPVLNTKIYENPNEETYLPQNNDDLSPVLNTKTFEKPTEESFLIESPVLHEKRHHSDSENELNLSPIINQYNVNLILSQNSDDLSPVLNKKTHKKPTEESFFIESPVLHEKRHHSDSEGEFNSSPVISRNKNKLIKLGKIRLQINNTCVRQLTQLQENNSEIINNAPKNNTYVENIDIESVKSQKQIIPVNNETNKSVCNKIFKNFSWKFKQNEEKVEIETYESQEISNNALVGTNIETIEIKSLHKRRKQQKWKIGSTEEKADIELINSQEILPNQCNNETNKSKCNDSKVRKLQPTDETEIELINSQESLKFKNETNITEQSNESKVWKLQPTKETEIELINSQESFNFKNETNKTKQSNESKVRKLQPTEETEIILINPQEILTQKSLNIETSQSSRKTSEDEKCVIDSVESQISSLVTISSNGTVVQDSLEKSSEEYQLSPRKKKKYKPGTLAYQFHKLLRKQKADVAIWKHELYLTSTSTYQIPATKEDHLITNLKICKMFVDFGTNIWECIQSDLNNEKCLVVANISLLDNLSPKNGDSIKIIPPFYITYVLVNNFNIKTFINVNKIMIL